MSTGMAFWTFIPGAHSHKLIALSGLVKEMSLLLKGNYLAGLRKNGFASELLWPVFKPNIANNGTPSFRPEPYRAPTWSWASIDGQVVTGACYLPY